ncbi:MAG: SCP2 sterol-binding domain-containing protein [Gammaproteobacteria bacterium]|nr:SCP2 sterol-binding domain-containing protein [Gammaproteobacteria bacterium]NNF60180.1 hypothetical protein [Gammaproteobacteria bacterium]NNM21593.1 hypothetical protein [Gammaproteobacteria bacterium]
MSGNDPLLEPLRVLLNRQLHRSTPAREAARSLEGRTLALSLRNTALTLFLTIREGEFELHRNYAADPDVFLETTPLGLVEMTRGGAGSGRMAMTGDPVIAQHFQQLLQHARPDWEEELSTIIGDVAAHQVGSFVRNIMAFGERATDSMGRNTAEFIQEERREVPAPGELDDFSQQVAAVAEKVDKLARRIDELTRRTP